MNRSPLTKPMPQPLPPWPLFPHLPQRLPPLKLRLPLPLTTSSRITTRNPISTALPAVKWIVALHIASYAAKKATSYPAVLPAQSFNASFASKHTPAPAPRLEDKYWKCQPARTTPTPILTYI